MQILFGGEEQLYYPAARPALFFCPPARPAGLSLPLCPLPPRHLPLVAGRPSRAQQRLVKRPPAHPSSAAWPMGRRRT